MLCGVSGVEGIDIPPAVASMQTIRIAKPYMWAKRVKNEQHPQLQCLARWGVQSEMLQMPAPFGGSPECLHQGFPAWAILTF